MTTTSDALEILTIVAACHPRTAPRMDDPDVARATAHVWAELLDEYGFTVTELIAAVKSRAQMCPDTPEVADIIRVARANRNDELSRTLPEEKRDEHPGDTKAAEDPADYPADWNGERCTAAYWYTLKNEITPPRHTAGWMAIDKARQRDADETRQRIRRLREKLDGEVPF